jgi:hypothetical protein
MFGTGNTGVAMMLKMMGVEPDELIGTFNGVAKNIAIAKIQMDRMEAKLDLLLGPEKVAEINARFPALPVTRAQQDDE